jgi:hypothetical protein
MLELGGSVKVFVKSVGAPIFHAAVLGLSAVERVPRDFQADLVVVQFTLRRSL